jgi:hypothetical protein
MCFVVFVLLLCQWREVPVVVVFASGEEQWKVRYDGWCLLLLFIDIITRKLRAPCLFLHGKLRGKLRVMKGRKENSAL